MYVILGAKIGGLPETVWRTTSLTGAGNSSPTSCTSQEPGHDQFIFRALDSAQYLWIHGLH